MLRQLNSSGISFGSALATSDQSIQQMNWRTGLTMMGVGSR